MGRSFSKLKRKALFAFRDVMSFIPHPHVWHYFEDSLGKARECKICWWAEFTGEE